MRFLFASCLLLLAALPVAAAEKTAASSQQTALGSFGGWHAFSFQENGQPVCYMTLASAASNAKLPKRGPSRLTITHRPADNTKDVTSYTSGYPFKGGSSADMLVGKAHFDLFTDKETAWARDNATDHALAAAIRANPSLTVTGTPLAPKAKPVIDRFELKGAAAAYAAIGKACGYPPEKAQVSPPAPRKAKPHAARH